MFHKQAMSSLDDLMPKLDYELSRFQKGMEITQISSICSDKKPIAKPLHIIIDNLLAQDALEEEGLFRLPGAISKVKQLCAALNAPNFDGSIMEFNPCNQALASTLKQFLRDLKSPILAPLLANQPGFEISFKAYIRYKRIQQVEQCSDHEERFALLIESINEMAEFERYNFAYLCRFCREVRDRHKVNLMSANALAICWAPTLIGQTSTSGAGTLFVQECIEWAESLFPESEYPKLENQGLSFNFTDRATELKCKAKLAQQNIEDEYGFIGRNQNTQAPVSSVAESQAHNVLNSIRTKRPGKKAAPSVPNAMSLSSYSESGRVQILHSTTPNLSARSNLSSISAEKVRPPDRRPPKPQKRTSKMTDHTGMDLLSDSDGTNSEPDETTSLTEELTSRFNDALFNEGISSMGLDSNKNPKRTESRPAKPPPPKPAVPNVIYNMESTKSQANHGSKPKEKPRPNPKPRRIHSSESEMTQM